MTFPRGCSFSLLAPLLLLAFAASAVPDGLSPEQRALLERLPPAQRELLRRALTEETTPRPPPAVPDEREQTATPAPAPAPPASVASVARLQAGDTVLIHFEQAAHSSHENEIERGRNARVPEESAAGRQDPAGRERLRAARLPSEPLFVLDRFGAITIDNVGRYTLAGLSEAEAAARLAAEPAFEGMHVRVRRLPIEPALKRFGHDLFARGPETFAPAAGIPVPADYVVGPGDTLIIQLLGKENAQLERVVTRDGTLLVPGIGPIVVAGMKFSHLRRELYERIERQFIGTRASVTVGRLRSIRVFVLGEVARPGSHTVGGLSTLTNALFASGGVKPIGSLRNIMLKRGGERVARLDLYDLLLRGDTRGDARLFPGDVIFVPPAGPVVGIGGQVQRPALYELKGETTLQQLVAMAGGLLPDAERRQVRIERVAQGLGRSVVNADLTLADGRRLRLQDGDTVRVYAMPERLERTVRLVGRVQYPGDHEWRPGMRLSDLVPSVDLLEREANMRYVLVVRARAGDGLELLSANLAAALTGPGGPEDIPLKPRDEVRVFGRHEDRAALIAPLLERARQGASPARPWREVSVGGSVHHPGRFPWRPGMTVADLIRAGGGLTEQAYTLEAELTRYVADGELRAQRHELLRLDPGKPANAGAAMRLEPHDRLVIRRIPHWANEGTVEIRGEVRFPGRYPIALGERLSDVLARAGGLTEAAYPRAAVFLRESVRRREQNYIEQLVAQLQRDLALIRTQGPEIGVAKEAALGEGGELLRQMGDAQASGRMVVDIKAVVDASDDYDVALQDGDKLVIPSRPDEVTVIGEVYYPTSHVYVPGRTRDDYVRLSGGITERGNRGAVYVVHADGSVSPPRRWYEPDAEVGPGDTVIVPVKVDRVGNLKLFTDVSSILFQLSVTAAALNSAGVF